MVTTQHNNFKETIIYNYFKFYSNRIFKHFSVIIHEKKSTLLLRGNKSYFASWGK